jgi:hypothetical protein
MNYIQCIEHTTADLGQIKIFYLVIEKPGENGMMLRFLLQRQIIGGFDSLPMRTVCLCTVWHVWVVGMVRSDGRKERAHAKRSPILWKPILAYGHLSRTFLRHPFSKSTN